MSGKRCAALPSIQVSVFVCVCRARHHFTLFDIYVGTYVIGNLRGIYTVNDFPQSSAQQRALRGFKKFCRADLSCCTTWPTASVHIGQGVAWKSAQTTTTFHRNNRRPDEFRLRSTGLITNSHRLVWRTGSISLLESTLTSIAIATQRAASKNCLHGSRTTTIFVHPQSDHT
jgi:hypothetical protein